MSQNRIMGCVFKHKALLLSRKEKVQESATFKKNEAGDSESVNPIDLGVTADATAKPGKISHSFVKWFVFIFIHFIRNIYLAAYGVEDGIRITEGVSESEILQLDDNGTNLALNKSETFQLFQDSNEDEKIGESQLMALCSGAFVTQRPGNVSQVDRRILCG